MPVNRARVRESGARKRAVAGGKAITLSHIDRDGAARMVDVSTKETTAREAQASAEVKLKPAVLDLLMQGGLPKGDALAAARLAGIMAAKRTADWIPLCHPLSLDWVQIDFSRTARGVLQILCTARTTGRTGVEMEALTGATASALTIYDMTKAADKSIVIGPVQLERKTGGKSGSYTRQPRDSRARR